MKNNPHNFYWSRSEGRLPDWGVKVRGTEQLDSIGGWFLYRITGFSIILNYLQREDNAILPSPI